MIPLFVLIGLVLAPAAPQDSPPAPIVNGVTSTHVAEEVDDQEQPPAEWTPAPLRLELHEAISAAMSNNTSLQGALLDAEAAWSGYGASWGVFDTTFFSTLTKSERVNPPSPNNFLGGSNFGPQPVTEIDVLNWRTGLRGVLETDTQWSLGVGPTWVRTTTRNSVPVLKSDGGTPANPDDDTFFFRDSVGDTYTADITLSLTQPLLRGSDGYTKTGVELAVHDSNIAALDSERVATETLEAVITAYWNLVFAVQDVNTRALSVMLSEELLGITRRKYEQGLQNRLDVVEVEAELARRNEEELTAIQGHEKAMDELRKLILVPDATDWNRPLEALTDWNTAVERISERLGDDALDEEGTFLTALSYRPDVRRARMALERSKVELRRARTEALPRLDVTGSYGLLSNERRNTSNALDALDDTSFHNASVFLDFEMPLSNRQGDYNERRRILERERALVTVREAEVNALAEVRDALRSVQLQTAKIATSTETVRLRREVYEGERRRLENDLSTPYQVREFQRDLLEAIDNQTRAQLDLAVAWTRLVAAQGLLVSQSGYALPLLEASPDEAPPTL